MSTASPSIYRRRDRCRGCDSRDLDAFLSLGPMPLVNAFPTSPEAAAAEVRFPLDVSLCRSCALVQLVDVIDPGTLFRDYLYASGTADTMLAHYAQLSADLGRSLALGSGDLVIEIASNNGCLLERFRNLGVRTLGIEPAGNLAAAARRVGIETLELFFTAEVGRHVRRSEGAAKLVLANNVLAHVDDPCGFLVGIRELLAEGGEAVIEVPYIGDMLASLEYDTIYHEHLSYFSATALRALYARAGLRVTRVERIPVHGGSLRVFAAPGDGTAAHADDFERMVRAEAADGLGEISRYRRFADEVREHREATRGFIEGLRRGGKTIAAYGASAKGNVMLNACDVGTDLVPYVVDKSPLKVGRLTPGKHLPVLPVATLAERPPDYLWILAWNFADEIMRQQQAFRAGGGRFVTTVPRARVH